MRKFLIKVNGTAYEVEVEETGGAFVSANPAPQMIAPAPAPAPVQSAPRPAPAAVAPAGKSGSEIVKAPMPGTILAISVTVGDAVEKNQVLCVLEAMKMENEIVAPRAGVIASINTSKGSSVNAGDSLLSLE